MNRKHYVLLGIVTLVALLSGLGLHQLARADEPVAVAGEAGAKTWTVEAIGIGNFRDIEMTSSEGGWVSAGRALYHYNGTTWQLGEAQDAWINDIAAVSETNAIWAVGFRPSLGSNEGGGVWRYDGTEWQRFLLPIGSELRSIHMLSPTDGWASGGGTVLRYTGTTWEVVSNTLSLYGMDGVASDDVWGVSGGGIFHYNGTQWQQASEIDDLNAISMLSTDDGWAVGGSRWDDTSVIAHYDGSDWITTTNPTDNALNDVQMLTADDGWAVGNEGTILHYDGDWQIVPSPTTQNLSSISMVTANDGWAVGNEVILHYNGSEWRVVNDLLSPGEATSNNLSDVDILSSDEGWAVGGDYGDYGEILRYDGTDWITVANPATND
jgi:hypothetical protein